MSSAKKKNSNLFCLLFDNVYFLRFTFTFRSIDCNLKIKFFGKFINITNQ